MYARFVGGPPCSLPSSAGCKKSLPVFGGGSLPSFLAALPAPTQTLLDTSHFVHRFIIPLLLLALPPVYGCFLNFIKTKLGS